MIKHLSILATQLLACLSVFFVMEGMAWIDEGMGIHPMFAGAMALVTFILPHLIEETIK